MNQPFHPTSPQRSRQGATRFLILALVLLVTAGLTACSPFAEIPHPTLFFYRNRPWFIPLAAWYFRLLDALN